VLRVPKRNSARHDDRGNCLELVEHPTGLVNVPRLPVARGEIAGERRVLGHILPGCEKCGDRIVEPALKKVSAADQYLVRRISKSRAQANGGLDVLYGNIRLSRVKS